MMSIREMLDTMYVLGITANGLNSRDAIMNLTPEQVVKLEAFVRAEKERRTQMKKDLLELTNSFK